MRRNKNFAYSDMLYEITKFFSAIAEKLFVQFNKS